MNCYEQYVYELSCTVLCHALMLLAVDYNTGNYEDPA